jgi:hypothetical protein
LACRAVVAWLRGVRRSPAERVPREPWVASINSPIWAAPRFIAPIDPPIELELAVAAVCPCAARPVPRPGIMLP